MKKINHNTTIQYARNIRYGVDNKNLLKIGGYSVFSTDEWKTYSSLNRISRNDGYGVWGWFYNTNLKTNFENVFIKPKTEKHTHVIWYSKENLIEMNNDPHKRSNMIMRQWNRYYNKKEDYTL